MCFLWYYLNWPATNKNIPGSLIVWKLNSMIMSKKWCKNKLAFLSSKIYCLPNIPKCYDYQSQKIQFPKFPRRSVCVCSRPVCVTWLQRVLNVCFSQLALSHQTSWRTHMSSWLAVGAQYSPTLMAFISHDQSCASHQTASPRTVTVRDCSSTSHWPLSQQLHVRITTGFNAMWGQEPVIDVIVKGGCFYFLSHMSAFWLLLTVSTLHTANCFAEFKKCVSFIA